MPLGPLDQRTLMVAGMDRGAQDDGVVVRRRRAGLVRVELVQVDGRSPSSSSVAAIRAAILAVCPWVLAYENEDAWHVFSVPGRGRARSREISARARGVHGPARRTRNPQMRGVRSVRRACVGVPSRGPSQPPLQLAARRRARRQRRHRVDREPRARRRRVRRVRRRDRRSPGSPGWWPARSRWPPGSTCRSARSATPSGPTCAWRSASFAATRPASCASSPASTSSGACRRRWRARSRRRCRAAARCERTPATSWASTRRGWRGRFRRRGRRRCRSRRVRRSRCWPSR